MADVGQVQFQVLADGLDATLQRARELETILNHIDGRTVTPGVTRSAKALRQATRQADSHEVRRHRLLREQANLEKKIALQQRRRIIEESKAADKFKKQVSTGLVERGERLQSLGNALQNISAPFTNIYRGLTMGVGYRLLGKVTESISGAFSRYDTIKTYSKVLGNLGVDATKKFSVAGEKATDVYHNLENAVLGLPTGIDEIIESMRRYAGATGEAERATKLAIAANNAYIAGHMGDREKLFTERQLVALAGGAELSSNQWDSLRRNAPLAMKVVAKDMKMSVQDMIDSLKKGQISGEKFLDVFIKAGTEGKIKNAAQVMKQTWDAVAQNFQNRMNAMGEGILNALDSVFKKMDGRSFLQHVLGVDKNGEYIGGGIRGVIDDMSQSVQKWIKANPEKITNFFDNLGKINWKSIVGGFAEFSLTMGRFYAWLGKLFGNGLLVKAMLWSNVIGKVLTIGGGALKGSAGFLAGIATLAKFGGAGNAAKKLGSMADMLRGTSQVGEAASTMALSWQGVASKALTIAAIPAIAWSLKEVAVAMQEFTKIDMSKLSVGKFAAAAGAITAFGGLAAALGALTTGHVIGWITTASTAVGIAEVASISKTMKWLGEGLNAIADAKIPDASRIKRVMESVKQIESYFKSRNPFEAIGTIFDSWTKTAEFKSMKTMTDAFTGIQNMVGIKMKHGWKHSAKKRFGAIFSFATDLETIMIEADKEVMDKSTKDQAFAKGSKAKQRNESFTVRKQRMREFAEMAESYAGGIGNLNLALKAINSLNTRYDKMKDNKKVSFDWGAIKKRISRIANFFYSMALGDGEESPLQKLRDAAKKMEGVDYTKITEMLGELPKIIGKFDAINNKIQKSSLFSGNTATMRTNALDLETRLKPLTGLFDAIKSIVPSDVSGFRGIKVVNNAMTGIMHAFDNLKKISSLNTESINIGNIQTFADRIKEALTALQDISGQTIDLSLTIDGKVDDKVKPLLDKEYKKIKDAIDQFDKLPKSKTITVTISARVLGTQAAIQTAKDAIELAKSAIAGINAHVNKPITVHTGAGGHVTPHNGGKIHPIYRAHGGSVFNSRGTDIVPAMLTPGEYVVNRMAASRVGDETLWRLNHMDLAGALRSLSARVGQSIVPRGNVINNTTNNTRNNNVSIHNSSSAGVGLGRANRWVMSL